MSRGFNHEKLNRYDRVRYRPKQGARPASQAQINYIMALARDKGQPKPRLPQTMRGAGEMIERLLDLPDVPQPEVREIVPVETTFTPRKELVQELKDTFPQLTPMTANSLVQLAEAVCDETSLAFFVNELAEDVDLAPVTTERLVPWLMKRFLAFSAA